MKSRRYAAIQELLNKPAVGNTVGVASNAVCDTQLALNTCTGVSAVTPTPLSNSSGNHKRHIVSLYTRGI